MRTPKLAPRILHEGCDDATCDSGLSRERCLGARAKRAETFPDLRKGRLQIFFPDDTLSDGFAEQETEGFFDVHNTPPWDTWVAFLSDPPKPIAPPRGHDRYLLYYIPEPFVGLGQLAVDLIAEECVQWLSDSNTLLSKRLLQHLPVE